MMSDERRVTYFGSDDNKKYGSHSVWHGCGGNYNTHGVFMPLLAHVLRKCSFDCCRMPPA